MRPNRFALMTAVCLGVVKVELAHGDPGDCTGNGPLVVGYTTILGSVEAPAFLGEWRLPISPDSPDVMTDARVRVDLIKASSGNGSLVSLSFSFPDSNPWGLPFTFQRAELSWESYGKKFSAQVDWSQNCSGPGRSMYPHQAWTALIEIGSSALTLKDAMERPVFKVWGSRN